MEPPRSWQADKDNPERTGVDYIPDSVGHAVIDDDLDPTTKQQGTELEKAAETEAKVAYVESVLGAALERTRAGSGGTHLKYPRLSDPDLWANRQWKAPEYAKGGEIRIANGYVCLHESAHVDMLARFVERAEPAPDLKSVTDWTAPATDREWLTFRWRPVGELVLFAGEGGTGKSWLAIQLGCVMASGTRRVVYAGWEDGAWRYECHASRDTPDDLGDLNRLFEAFADGSDAFRPHRALDGQTPADDLRSLTAQEIPASHRSRTRTRP